MLALIQYLCDFVSFFINRIYFVLWSPYYSRLNIFVHVFLGLDILNNCIDLYICNVTKKTQEKVVFDQIGSCIRQTSKFSPTTMKKDFQLIEKKYISINKLHS